MIDTIEKLYDHVNRYGLEGRRMEGDVQITARLSVAIKRPLVFLAGRQIEDLDGLEVLSPSTWCPLSEYPNEEVARWIERLEGLHRYQEALRNFEGIAGALVKHFDAMHADDQKAFTAPEIPSIVGPTEAYVEGIRSEAP